MRKIHILICFLSFTLYSFSQKPTLSSDFSLEISDRYTEIKSIATYNFVYLTKALLIKKNKDHLTLQRFDLEGLKKSSEKSQIIEDKGDFVGILQLSDYVYVFYATRNKLSVQKVSILSRVIQAPKTLLNSKSSIADDFGFSSTYGFNSEGKIHKFAVKKSFDEKLFFVQYLLDPGLLANKQTKDVITVAVFDATLTEISKQQIQLPYAAEKVDKIGFAIDNQANHYMSIKVRNGEKMKTPVEETTEVEESEEVEKAEETEAIEPYHVEILKTKVNTGTAIAHKVNLEDAAILNEMVFQTDTADRMHLIGLYKNSLEATQISGMVDTSLKEDGSPERLVTYAIADSIRAKFDAERQTRIDNGSQPKDDIYDLQNLKINSAVFEGDGSLLALTEQRYVTTKYMSTGTGIRPKYTYHYRNMYAFQTNSSDLQWFQRLPKHQMGIRGKRSLSYTYMKGGGNYYLLFLDNFKNLRLPLDGFPYTFFEGKGGYLYVVAYKIEQANGATSKVAVINTKDIKGLKMNQFYTDKIARLNDRNLLIEGFDNKKKNFLLKLSVKN